METNSKFDNTLCKIFRGMGYFAGGVGALMMIVSVINIIMRSVFSAPLYGTVELIGYSGLLLGAFSIAHNEVSDGNINMTLFTDKMKPKMKAVCLGISSIFCFAFYGVISYRFFIEILSAAASNAATTTIRIPMTLINFLMFVGFGMGALAFLLKIIRNFTSLTKSEKKKFGANTAENGAAQESCLGGV